MIVDKLTDQTFFVKKNRKKSVPPQAFEQANPISGLIASPLIFERSLHHDFSSINHDLAFGHGGLDLHIVA